MAFKADNELMMAEVIRDDLGELGVYLTAAEGPTRVVLVRARIAVERWEALAVLTLWLAMDCVDELQARVEHDPPMGFRPVEPAELFPDGVPANLPGVEHEAAIVLALDSMRASTLAVQERERSVNRAAMLADGVHAVLIAQMDKRDEAVRRDRSQRARNASQARWEPKKLLMAKALEIARSEAFSTYQGAAEAIEGHVPCMPKGTKAYTVDTIIRWLQAAGWQPTKTSPKRSRKG